MEDEALAFTKPSAAQPFLQNKRTKLPRNLASQRFFLIWE
jgi:hypothetical protein